MKKKIVLLTPAALLIIYLLWLGYLLLSFRTYTRNSPTDPPEAEGVYHIHSKFSDGRQDVDKIIRAGVRNGLDFIILTDHGNPNLPSLASQGWKQGLLVLAGSELSVSRGHMVALDFRLPSRSFSQNTEAAVHEIAALGGFTVIAHPYVKVKWSWGEYVGYSGLEIVNADSMLRANLGRVIPYLPALLISPKFVLLRMLNDPSPFLRRWDERSLHFPLYGYFSLDAHVFYRPVFSLLHLHLLLQTPLSKDFETAKDQVFGTLRRGRFYNAVDAAAPARGFGFTARSGDKKIAMGETASIDSMVTFEVDAPYSFGREIRLICDGKEIASSPTGKLSYETAAPGIYRAEVYLREKSPLNGNVPWIVSNPIILKKETRR